MMSNNDKLPNFFILGSAKCGTTSLYKYLKQHEEVYFPLVKEPQFFSNDNEFSKGLEYYIKRYFQGSEKYPLRGEATPHYIYYEKAAKRIANSCSKNKIKFIVILRNPVERAYSLYWNMKAEGYETLDFPGALAAESSRIATAEAESLGSVRYQYVDSGFYAVQIKKYLKYFNKDQFLFLLHEDLKKSPATTMYRVFEFLDLKKINVNVTGVHNRAGATRNTSLQKILRGDLAIKRWVGKLLPYSIKYRLVESLLKLNRKELKYEPMSEEVYKKLNSIFISDIVELEKILDVDLSNWKKPHKLVSKNE